MARREWFTVTDGIRTYYDGTIEYLNEDGELHREDGPAAVWYSGEIWWFLNGERLSFCEWCQQLRKSDAEKAYMLSKYGIGSTSTWIIE